ncbi:MAG: hypothetical protein RLY71_952 [Pseudomonadota bacterium]|jgi:sugar O-acyltransferase (sialic acid O-acetyltransferase NeuD family)
MSLPDLLLIGTGGHSHACIDAIEQQGRYRLIGLVGADGEAGGTHLGYPVIGTDKDLPSLVHQCSLALIGIGHIQSAAPRQRLYGELLALGFTLPVVVAASAYVSRHAQLGAGTLVQHGAIINAGARVGVNCIINSRALVEHDTQVGDHCHIATGAILNGGVSVGAASFVGSGSAVRQGLAIGQQCIIGMGLALRHAVPDHTRFVGNSSGSRPIP